MMKRTIKIAIAWVIGGIAHQALAQSAPSVSPTDTVYQMLRVDAKRTHMVTSVYSAGVLVHQDTTRLTVDGLRKNQSIAPRSGANLEVQKSSDSRGLQRNTSALPTTQVPDTTNNLRRNLK